MLYLGEISPFRDWLHVPSWRNNWHILYIETSCWQAVSPVPIASCWPLFCSAFPLWWSVFPPLRPDSGLLRTPVCSRFMQILLTLSARFSEHNVRQLPAIIFSGSSDAIMLLCASVVARGVSLCACHGDYLSGPDVGWADGGGHLVIAPPIKARAGSHRPTWWPPPVVLHRWTAFIST